MRKRNSAAEWLAAALAGLALAGVPAIPAFASDEQDPEASADDAAPPPDAPSEPAPEAVAKDVDKDGANHKKTFWELGIGMSGISFPDYVGSDQRRNWPLPFPYVVYQGKRINVDQGTVSGILPLTNRLSLDISAGGALPVDSRHNKAREGMDDLDAIVEVGPSLKYDIYRSSDDHRRLILDLPLRAATAVAFDHVAYEGLISSPSVEYRMEQPADDGRWVFRAATGPLFSDGQYNSYFYAVGRDDATSRRRAFDTDGGYGGWRIAGGVARRWDQFWFGGFVRYINISGAVFENSPLVKTNSYLIGGVGVAWVFATSKRDD
jgi:MipA family protein